MARTGRPLTVDRVVRHREDGSAVTIAEQVIERIRLGQDLIDASDSAGIARATLHKWRLTGARSRAEVANGGRITANEKRLVEFVDALERAEGEAEASRLAIIHRVAEGGAVVTKTTTKHQMVYDGDGEYTGDRLVERTVVTETLRPEWTAAAWWLERRRKGYSRKVEVTGADGAPLVPEAEQARNLADSLRDYLAGAAAGVAVAEGAQ